MLVNIISFASFLTIFFFYYIAKDKKDSPLVPKDSTNDNRTAVSTLIPMPETKPLQKLIFWSHGGPTFAIKDHPHGSSGAFNKVEELGNQIKNNFKPDYIVIISAHWQPNYSSKQSLSKLYLSDTESQDQSENELIYDFYRFPKDMYSWTFENTFSKDLIKRITALSDDSDVKIEPKVRGLDHGLWVPGKVAQLDKPADDGLLIPVVQLSMLPNAPAFGDDTVDIKETLKKHYDLGTLVNKIRADNGVVVLSGMSVHNLVDRGSIDRFESTSYSKIFNEYLRNLILADESEKKAGNVKSKSLYEGLLKLGEDHKLTDLLLQAHAPGIDHFLPFVIGCGALTENEYFEEVFNQELGSLGWGIYVNHEIERN